MSASGTSFPVSFIAGGVAGMTVDVTLFPLDTLRTRLQSPNGFWTSGGFRGLYKGIGPTMMGSVPTASLFFCTYNGVKNVLQSEFDAKRQIALHVTAAASAEVVSCLVKVPTEILKQRQQVGLYSSSIFEGCRKIYKSEGMVGFYRGLSSTILREIPFAVIQFPVWEWLKVKVWVLKQQPITAAEKAGCGALAGGVAASLTTPLDVAKTRIMLFERTAKTAQKLKISQALMDVYKERGIPGLFAGFVPRVLWITLGGAVFFGSYEISKDVCNSYLLKDVDT